MAVVASRTPVQRTRLVQPKSQSLYERFASWLITLLITVGVAVVCMLVVWLTSRITSNQVVLPILLDDLGGGRPDGVVNESMKIDGPDVDEIVKETDVEVEQEQIQDTAALIVDAVALKMVELDDPALTEELEASPKQAKADGTGNAYALGEGPGQRGGVARGQRWRIRFDQTTLDTYARQLDHFKIELACIKPGRVEYVSNVSRPAPTKRTALTGEKEDRLFFTWEDGTLQRYDRQLLAKGGVNPDGIIAQFYPPQTENLLANLEKQKAGDRDLRTIRRTIFGVRPSGGGFEFYVLELQTF